MFFGYAGDEFSHGFSRLFIRLRNFCETSLSESTETKILRMYINTTMFSITCSMLNQYMNGCSIPQAVMDKCENY